MSREGHTEAPGPREELRHGGRFWDQRGRTCPPESLFGNLPSLNLIQKLVIKFSQFPI